VIHLPEADPTAVSVVFFLLALFCLVQFVRGLLTLRLMKRKLRRIEQYILWLETADDAEAERYDEEMRRAGRDWDARGPWEKL
jgi:hypothetical protein